MKLFDSIRQIIIYVTDMDKQVHFYRDILGFKVITPGQLKSYKHESWVALDTGQVSLCLHAGGSQRFGPDAPKFTFESKNIYEAQIFLKNYNVECSDIRSPVPDKFVFDAKDPEGNKFSIEQF
jgi:catechol 2,3-dioxygenase-like lactoylglutathione lyase family enzyme